MDANITTALSWERMAQFHLIEVIALWEGRLTSNHLQDAFSIGRNKASDILKSYQQVAPGNIYHCSQTRGYVPDTEFDPCFSHGEVHEYLDLLHSNSFRDSHFYALQTWQAPIDRLHPLTRPVNPDVVRVIMQAVRQKQRITVCYRSFSNPDGAERLIAPHTLVSASGRWHVRAFCEKDQRFKDFMLHRFVSIPEIDSDRLEMANPEHDKEWFKTVEMVLIPNPALDPERQQLVADDYAMGPEKQLKVTLRAPLVKYMAVELRIGTPEQTQDNPNAHQLTLANRDELGGLIL
ncbi:WYL domain-containing protein [Marinobacterium marinum]|uniref:WYL domain-containing protein n=1 Tax=Marinobacterium marinum TaxID=2756129 RepID=A0A7W1WVU8_9GAMM|nr:WYL domain-containing protein [Marinobacterium marinum]MBA4500946.1 WYL domain-containing protein [Marinobacterium marinum]